VALNRFLSKRYTLNTGKPAAVHILDNSVDFVLNQGILITLSHDTLHCISIQDPLKINQRYSIERALRTVDPDGEAIFSLAHYSDNFVFLLQKAGWPGEGQAALIIINLTTLEHCIVRIAGWGNRDPLILNDARYCFLCWYSRPTARDSFGTWIIQSTALPGVDNEENPSELQDVELPHFASEEVGTAVAFRIHNGWFYALSNGELMDPRGIDMDYGSPQPAYYRLWRFPVDSSCGREVQKFEKIFRRDPSKGPLHNAWVELSLHVDEATDNLVVVEVRREWLNMASKPSRACHLTYLSIGARERSHLFDPSIGNGGDEELQYVRKIHPERGVLGDTTIPLPRTNKTKFRGYNASVGAFVELVVDENECLKLGQPTLVLRSSGRSAGALPAGVCEAATVDDLKYTPVHRWAGCPVAIDRGESYPVETAQEATSRHLIKSNIKASMDSSCLVYMEQKDPRRRSFPADVSPRQEEMSPVILVSFDHGIDLWDAARGGWKWGWKYEWASYLDAELEQQSRSSTSPI
jgi:hypothetical protein